tara:strand:- start:5738 stop:5998 length:261 start_codon:yes stop_codon:yes gene_type:complete
MALPKREKFTKDELKSLTDIRDKFSEVSYKIGQIRIQKIQLDEQEKLVLKELDANFDKEKEVAKTLIDKYGKGTIDIDSGEFIPAS